MLTLGLQNHEQATLSKQTEVGGERSGVLISDVHPKDHIQVPRPSLFSRQAMPSP